MELQPPSLLTLVGHGQSSTWQFAKTFGVKREIRLTAPLLKLASTMGMFLLPLYNIYGEMDKLTNVKWVGSSFHGILLLE